MPRGAAATALVSLVIGTFVTGCAGMSGESGKATLWVTRDRGRHLVLRRTVAAGQTAMQALEGAADVDTRYGGRFVQAIDGVSGSLSARRDWFYFVNGIEADRSASEYRLHPGDVEWWDFRSWAVRMEEPVVVGAFPEPLLHGYGGSRRATAVRYSTPGLASVARAIGRVTGAASVARAGAPVARDANLVLLRSGKPGAVARPRFQGFEAGDPVAFVFSGRGVALARHPRLLRRRYRWP
jgi:Domain of unknown function (DUF4430)